ncbi:hypothetical protein [Absidia glauca]|uniref:Zn(2)-C6 fungal-type domain-containing protein n=1 Tax=Absidia glauca TaxID=4829 RepID=A0A168NGH3_ABSGL|nr:hypothetical protein [Absidia glauca]
MSQTQTQAPPTSGINASSTGNSATPNFAEKGKRTQVRNACVHCQKACKKCASERPCPRCLKFGYAETCVDSVRKKRQQSTRRGPYKKRKEGNQEKSNLPVALICWFVLSFLETSSPQQPNGTTPIPTSSVSGGGDKPSIQYPDFVANTPFENFPGFQGGTSYIPYNILNDMNIIIQAANKATKDINDAEQDASSGSNNTNDKAEEPKKDDDTKLKPEPPAIEPTPQEKNEAKANDVKVDKDESDDDNASQYGTPESSGVDDVAPRNGDDQ